MQGDFTRFTFDRSKHYNRVLKQQGRVDLDADWNELNDIFEYLDDTTRIDVIGKVGVPNHTPPFFDVTFAAPNLTITSGRIYVDGILVEMDADLLVPVIPAPGQKTLVFLDVWDRHITAIEDPHIREIALGGPDTCTRVKTEFQVRLQTVAASVTCANAVLPGPGTGALTSKVVPAPPSDDPCLIAPSGGFRGLENRLYRVEIHTGGALGTATYKWSRDNGSIVFAVTEFPITQPDRVRVSRLGRDQVLTFRRGDWVEVLNDDDELNGNHGTLAKILDIDETQLELKLSVNPPPSTLDKHPKVRRWDQPSDAIVTAAGPLDLEDGIQVSFSGTGSATDFKTGDYWVFAARTAAANGTGDIESLNNAPPKGIVHHYAALALVAWAAGGGSPVIEICPPKFPPLTDLPGGDKCCCCTVTVGPDGDFTTIQEAIDTPSPIGLLIVCLRPNIFNLAKPVIIDRDDVIIVGCHDRTRVVAPKGGPAFIVPNQEVVAIESMSIQGGGQWAIWFQGSQFRVRDCDIVGGGIWIANGSQRVEIADNELRNGDSPGIALRQFPPGMTATGTLDIDDVRITRNRIFRFADSAIACGVDPGGISTSGEVSNLIISHNQILQCALAGARAPYIVGKQEAAGGISLFFVARATIHRNRIERCGGERTACGIAVINSQGIDITHNLVTGNGIVPTVLTPGAAFQAGVIATAISDTLDGIASMRIVDNFISTPAGQSLLLASSGSMAITGNRLVSNATSVQSGSSVFGMSLIVVAGFANTTNDVTGDGRLLFQGNQVTSRITIIPPVVGGGGPLGDPQTVHTSRCFFASMDDTLIGDNQFLAQDKLTMDIHVLVGFSLATNGFDGTVRISGNRVTGGGDKTAISATGRAIMITGNQTRGVLFPASSFPPAVVVTDNVTGV